MPARSHKILSRNPIPSVSNDPVNAPIDRVLIRVHPWFISKPGRQALSARIAQQDPNAGP
jgi:hypothetical protein